MTHLIRKKYLTSQAYLITSVMASLNFVFPLAVNLIFFGTFRREFFYYFSGLKLINGSVRPTNTGTDRNKNITDGGIRMIQINGPVACIQR